MRVSLTMRYAARSLRRNFRRSLLSVAGIAIGVGLGLLGLGWIRGEENMMVRAAAGSGIGHMRVSPEGWERSRSPDLRLNDWEATLAAVRAHPGVQVATPRSAARALLGMGTRSANVELAGVDPSTEVAANRFVSALTDGRYLEVGEEGSIVLGASLVRRLGAQVDDELVVTVVDEEGEMQAALLTIVGVVSTGSRDIDAMIAQTSMADVEALTGRQGAAQIAVLGNDLDHLPELEQELSALMPEGNFVLPWTIVSPEMQSGLEGDKAFMNMAVFVVLVVVLLGVASAQLTGVLERRKEFAVLAALGTRGVQLVKIVVIEGMVLGLVSALASLLWGAPFIYYLSIEGVDFGAMMGDEGMAYGAVLIDPIFYPQFGAWLLPVAFVLSLIATTVASLYPAWFAARTDPASALRVG